MRYASVAGAVVMVIAVVLAAQIVRSGFGSEPPSKDELLQQEEDRRAAALNSATPGILGPDSDIVQQNEDAVSEPRSVPQALSRPAGDGVLLDGGQAPFSGSFYEFRNSWILSRPMEDLYVYSGRLRQTNEGIVIVGYDTPASTIVFEFYDMPYHGAAQILGAEGEVLALSLDGSETFYFDLPARKFRTAAGDEIVAPLYTPRPTPSAEEATDASP